MDDSCESAMQSASLLCPVEQRVLMFRCGRGIKGSAVRRAQKGITAELGSNANADGVSLDAFCVGETAGHYVDLSSKAARKTWSRDANRSSSGNPSDTKAAPATAGPRNPVHGCQDDWMDMVIRFLLLHVSQESRMLDILRHDFSVWQLVTDGAIPQADARCADIDSSTTYYT
ncbi:hypothetical protein MRX96_044262 [Rhipicephalus microplus]